MTDILLIVPLLTTPDFSTSAVNALLSPVGESLWDAGGSVRVGHIFGHMESMEVAGFGGFGASTSAFELGDRRFDATGATAELEAGPRWTWSMGASRGWAEAAAGVHARFGYPDWAPAAWTLGLGGHAAGGIDFGKGKVRPRIGLESSMTLATTSYSADVLLPDGTLSWAWNPSRLRVAVVVGVAFGAPVSGPS